MNLYEDLLLGRILPSISSTVTAAFVVFLIIRLFRIKNPETKYILLHLPLLKGLLVLIRGVHIPDPGTEHRFRFGLQIFDPFSIINIPDIIGYFGSGYYPNGWVSGKFSPAWDVALVHLSIYAATIAVAIILIYRWVGLSLFYRRILSKPAATPDDAPELFAILDRLVATLHVRYPRVILLDGYTFSPCVVGINPATIILPTKLIKQLDGHQLEAVLAHEMAHIARHDGLLHWPVLLLRDIQSYNPLVHRLFSRVLALKEIDADLRAVQILGNPKDLVKTILEVANIHRKQGLRPAPGGITFTYGLLDSASSIPNRIDAILHGPIKTSRLRPIGILLLLLYLSFVRIFVYFPAFGRGIVLE